VKYYSLYFFFKNIVFLLSIQSNWQPYQPIYFLNQYAFLLVIFHSSSFVRITNSTWTIWLCFYIVLFYSWPFYVCLLSRLTGSYWFALWPLQFNVFFAAYFLFWSSIKSFTLLFPTSRLDVKYDVIYRVFNHFSDLIIIIWNYRQVWRHI